MSLRPWSAVAALALCTASLNAQSLAGRVAAVRDGAVAFHFAARPGVCGDGEHYIRTGGTSYQGSFSEGRPMAPCENGPVQVRVTLEGGVVDRVQYWVGTLRSRDARDLGAVPAPEAARWLMTIAEHGTGRASVKAILPAVLADSAIVWPGLLAVAKDSDTRPRATRREALLWLSRYAGGAVSGRANDPLEHDEADATADDDLKAHAAFVLSQLPHGEGIPALLTAARANVRPHVKRQVFFWLGQSGDPRALELFESVLRS